MNNLKNGTGPYRIKRKDFDFIPSFHPGIYYGTIKPGDADYPKFPNKYLTDTSDWMPSQDAEGQPNGCTNYSTVQLARTLGVDPALATPQILEQYTGANAKGGLGVIDSIDIARTKLKWFAWRFIIQAKGTLDYFDAFRLAQSSGIPEFRAISWGTPWFPSWRDACNPSINPSGIMPMPTNEELAIIKSNIRAYGWHDHVLDGWTTHTGRLVYRDKSWQGNTVGQSGYIYFPREVINVVNDIYGTVAVTATSSNPPAFNPVNLPDWFFSFIHSLMGLAY